MTAAPVLGVLLAFSAIAIATAAGWVVAAVMLPLVERLRVPARARAALLAQVRLLPLALVVVLVATQANAFVRYEQHRAESAGPLLVLLAGCGIAILVDAIWRGARCWRQTSLVISEWKASATPFTLRSWPGPAWVIRPVFPVVAVVGAWRPELFIARQVIDGCTPEELAAIAAHEAAHVAARDNLVRWLFAVTPGARVCTSLAAELERRWTRAAEEAADSAAARNSSELALASALTKVARLAPSAPTPLAASALISVSDLEARVQDLLARPRHAPKSRGTWVPAATLVALFILTLMPVAGRTLHELFELLVRAH